MTYLLVLSFASISRPRWTWDTIQTYIHCANRTGVMLFSGINILLINPLFELYFFRAL